MEKEVTKFLNSLTDGNLRDIMTSDFERLDELRAKINSSGFKFESVDCCGGYDGNGGVKDYWAVMKISKGSESVHVKFDGSYYSYDCATFYEWFFVEPKQVMVTQWELVK